MGSRYIDFEPVNEFIFKGELFLYFQIVNVSIPSKAIKYGFDICYAVKATVLC